MLSRIVGNIRGLASGLVRSAVTLGRKATETFADLVHVGLDYDPKMFGEDWTRYEQMGEALTGISEQGMDELIKGKYHVPLKKGIKANFRYDITRTFEDIHGTVTDFYWSSVSDVRLTINQILDDADLFSQEYPPDEPGFWSEYEIVGAWSRV